MHPHDAVGVEAGEHADYPGTHVPALGAVALLAEAIHQLGEGPGGAGHLPTRLPDGRSVSFSTFVCRLPVSVRVSVSLRCQARRS
jgi:hypothetical protein